MRRIDAICSIEGCENSARARLLCGYHYEHWQTLEGRRGQCPGPECDRPIRKAGYCQAHYVQVKAGIALRPVRRWSTERMCVICGASTAGLSGRRKYCSTKCVQLARRYPDGVPEFYECAQCGAQMEAAGGSPTGRRLRNQIRLCRTCKRKRRSSKSLNVIQLAQRDGTDCSICGDAIDMTLRRPESIWGPSVDHVIPRALGGTDEPPNLALAHYWCNAVKNDRPNFTLRREVA